MANLSKIPVLVLNAGYEPLSFCNAKRSLTLLYKGKAKVEEITTHAVCTQIIWDDITGEFIKEKIYVPSVIRLLTYNYIPGITKMLTRKNIFNRDGYICQYCGKSFSAKQLTIDHIIPRSKGGKSTWENVVACCESCNRKKGNRLLSEISDMKLLHFPKPINLHTSKYLLRNMGADDSRWRKYLFYDSTGKENQWKD
jgi:hypothetical protein